SVRNGFISLGILIGCFIGVQLWTRALIEAERKRDREHAAEVRAVLADAPSRNNLPALKQEPAEEVLLPDFANCTRYSPQAKIVPEEKALPAPERTVPRALYPDRYSYSATYACDLGQNEIPVEVTAYPTAAWANYDVKPMPVLYEGKVWKIAKFGNNI